MSAIDNNPFASTFPGAGGAPAEFGSAAGTVFTGPTFGWKDSIQPNGSTPPCGEAGSFAEAGCGAPAGAADGGLAGFGSLMNGFISALQNLLSSLGRQFGFTSGASQPAAPGQTYFTNATTSSVGDPHDAFEGTPGSGSSVERKWNNMGSHADLLDSDSFAGGYRVSTVATATNDRGVTINKSASVALDGGSTDIALNGDGSYAVSSNGGSVTLAAGRAAAIGNGESVTLGADGSLSVSDANAAGGSLATVLSINGSGGVDVKSTASDVDLGGYLVDQSDTPRYPLPGPRREEAPAAQASYRLESAGEPELQGGIAYD